MKPSQSCSVAGSILSIGDWCDISLNLHYEVNINIAKYLPIDLLYVIISAQLRYFTPFIENGHFRVLTFKAVDIFHSLV